MREQLALIQTQALTDGLTGAWNRRFRPAPANRDRPGGGCDSPYTVILTDADGPAKTTTTFGHLAGTNTSAGRKNAQNLVRSMDLSPATVAMNLLSLSESRSGDAFRSRKSTAIGRDFNAFDVEFWLCHLPDGW
jgi:hypothetical protein